MALGCGAGDCGIGFWYKKLRNVGKDLGGAVHDFKKGLNEGTEELDALVIIHNKPMKQTEKRPTTTKMNSQESMKDRKKTRTNFCLQHHYLAR